MKRRGLGKIAPRPAQSLVNRELALYTISGLTRPDCNCLYVLITSDVIVLHCFKLITSGARSAERVLT